MQQKLGAILINNIKQLVDLKPEEESITVNAFTFQKYPSKHILSKPGIICKHVYFIVEGGIRSYTIDEKAKEHTFQLSIENNWIADLTSFIHQKKSHLYISTIEKSKISKIDFTGLSKLFKKVPAVEKFFEISYQNAYNELQNWRFKMLTSNAKERYEHFLHDRPDLARRIPLNMIASYLGITPESLSRIRRKM